MLPAQAGTGYIWSVNGICPSFSPSDTFDCLIAKNYAPGALRGDEYRMEQAGGELCPNGERTQYCVLIRNLQRDERWHKWQQDSRDDYISRGTKECPIEYDEGGHSKRFFFGVKESETYYSKGTFYYCHNNCVYGANVYVEGANDAPPKHPDEMAFEQQGQVCINSENPGKDKPPFTLPKPGQEEPKPGEQYRVVCPSGVGSYPLGGTPPEGCFDKPKKEDPKTEPPPSPNPPQPQPPEDDKKDDEGKGKGKGGHGGGGGSGGDNGDKGDDNNGGGSGGKGGGGGKIGGKGDDKGDGKGDGKDDGKGDGKGGIGGGNCAKGEAPTCKGDPVQCYIAREQWRSACLAEQGRTDIGRRGDCKTGQKPVCKGDAATCYQIEMQFEATCAAQSKNELDTGGVAEGFGRDVTEGEIATEIGVGDSPTKDGIAKQFGKEEDVSSWTNRFDDRGFLGSRQCMPAQEYRVAGISFKIDWGYLCLFLQYVGHFLTAMGYFIGFRIVSGGFDK